MKTTIKDVARESGFSIATVSLALSAKPNRIAKKTKEKIIHIANQLNYSPNRVAVSLATRKSRMIGLVIADVRNAHIASMFMAIDIELQKSGYILLCCTITNDPSCMATGVRNLIACGVDGIIFCQPDFVVPSKYDIEVINQIERSGLPVVSRDNLNAEMRGVGVRFDFFLGGYMATKHLIENGHRKIGCVAGPPEYRVTLERLNGYKLALQEAGIEFDQKLVYVGDYELESGSDALPYLLGQKVTAIFAFNDQMAFGIYRSARNYGIKIPQDLSVIGFDDVMFSDVLEVPLTSINVPTVEIGVTVAQEMINLIENGIPQEPKVITFEPNLMIRRSTLKINP